MNKKARLFIKNILYATGANLSRIFTTLILTLLLPRLLTVEDYSYWQLYLFYGTYMIYSSIGWCEGTYLKYGGCEYKNIDGRRLSSQFLNLSLYEGIVALILSIFAFGGIADTQKRFLVIAAACYMWMYILKYQLQTILQATNRISDYARVYSGERFLYFILVIVSLILGRCNVYLVIIAELISNAVSLSYGIYLCREVTLKKKLPLSVSIKETAELIQIGYKLTLAGLASQLIIGIVRFSIEKKWGTVIFGKISLSFSMANMIITCITAVSIVLFPMLKNSDTNKIRYHYRTLRSTLTIPMFGILLLYAPMKAILSWWLPKYADSLKYLAILFPLCIYEVRNSVLVWTYLKVLRKESLIMKANLIMIGMSIVMTFFSVIICNSLDLTVCSIVVLYAIKAIYTEWLLGKYIPICAKRDWLVETILSAGFIAGSWTLNAVGAFFVYLVSYGLYLLYKKGEIITTFKELKLLFAAERS